MRKAFYRFEDGLYHPQQAATGSWNKAHQNGTSIGGLLATGVADTPTSQPMFTARLTVDIMRPVPFQPIELRTTVTREGKQMQVVESQIVADGVVCARAIGLKVRIGQNPGAPEAPLPYPMPEDAGDRPVTSVLGAGHPMETRMVEGDRNVPGPGVFWTTFNADLIEGRHIAPLALTAMCADIGGAPSSVMSNKEWTYANIDLSVYLTREPRGDWLLIDCETLTEGNGVALVNGILCDREGPVGRSHHTLFIAPRG